MNDGGGGPPAPADDVKPNLATSIVRLNLLAPFFVAQAAADGHKRGWTESLQKLEGFLQA